MGRWTPDDGGWFASRQLILRVDALMESGNKITKKFKKMFFRAANMVQTCRFLWFNLLFRCGPVTVRPSGCSFLMRHVITDYRSALTQ